MSKISKNQMGTTRQINPIIISGNHWSNQPTQKMQLNSTPLFQGTMSKASNDKLETTCPNNPIMKEETTHQINPSPRDAIEVKSTWSSLTWRDVQSWSHQQPSLIFPPIQENHKTEFCLKTENGMSTMTYYIAANQPKQTKSQKLKNPKCSMKRDPAWNRAVSELTTR